MTVLAKQPRRAITRPREIARAGLLAAGLLFRTPQKRRHHTRTRVSSHRAAVRGHALARSPEGVRTVFRRRISLPCHRGEAHRCRPRRGRIRVGGAPGTAAEATTLFRVAARRPRRH